ncbi:MAG TPA: MmcQ/YjbR family DNA-binding protein [Caulobacteraceae bacterium]|nr:MmcQ/YjbR family DNA-binding protein [Caulobacteraceae bacterium]
MADLLKLLEAKPSAEASSPFGPGVIVYKIAGKMFAIVSDDAVDVRFTLKCDPMLAEVLRGEYAAITPGYHTDKRHWITIRQDAALPDDEIERLIGHAYDLVRGKLTRAARAALEQAEAR